VHPTGGSLRVFRQFAWLEVGSAKVALSRPIHQRVTQTVRTLLEKEGGKRVIVLSLWKIEDGACYISEETKTYVAWQLLCYSSKMFWGCEMIKGLDKAKSLSDRAFGNEPTAFPELINLLQSIESPLLDAVRIVICFENYFKARLLLEGYVIHRMDLNVCRERFPQFVTGKQKQLLQRTTPILLQDVQRAENRDKVWSVKPIQSLTTQTIEISTLLGQPKYRAVYSKGEEIDDELFSLLQELNRTRNSLHFLNVEYIASGGLGVDHFVFLRDYVLKHIDSYGENFYKNNEGSIKTGKMEIETLDPEEYSEES
jgi:hypothetical protein